MKTLMIFLLLPVLFNFKNSVIEIDDDSKAIIVITGSLMCHKCFVQINDRIISLKNRNFKYYVLLDSDNSIIDRRIRINTLKKYAKPDCFAFCKNSSEYNQLVEQRIINKFPELLIINNGIITHINYDDLFCQNNISHTLDSIVVNLNK